MFISVPAYPILHTIEYKLRLKGDRGAVQVVRRPKIPPSAAGDGGEDSESYGTGALLLAGSEIEDLI